MMENSNKLFISHSEKDREIISAFVDLLYDIGLKEKNMFCSSRTDIGVPIKEDIYEYLRSLLDSDNVIPIFMLSENYYKSPACLNEMGAVWIKQKDYFTFLLPEFEFKQIKGAINPNKKGIKLGNRTDILKGELNNFKNEICRSFGTKISDNRWEKQRDYFISQLNSTSPDVFIKLSEHRGYCIGEVNYNGCKITYDKARVKVIASYDFTKTKAEICSLVFFTGEINMHNQFLQNKHLCFSLKSINNSFEITVELRLKNRNVSYNIQVSNEWEDYSIPLQEFGGAESEWQILREVKFLAYRNNIKRKTIEIKDIKIL